MDWLKPETLATLVCRPALPKDTQDVIHLTKTIWGGDDYVPYVWTDWLKDPRGILAVAETSGKVVGLGKLTVVTEAEWWLEGLRVDPQLRGRKISSHLHAYLLRFWENSPAEILRLATASFRLPVQHLCERTGFRKAGEFVFLSAPALTQVPSRLQPVQEHEISSALHFAAQHAHADLYQGLMQVGWRWVSLQEQRIRTAVGQGLAWWLADHQGFVLCELDEQESEDVLAIQYLACPSEQLEPVLLELRAMAAQLDRKRLDWAAPRFEQLSSQIEAAGLQRTWEHSLYIFEKSRLVVL